MLHHVFHAACRVVERDRLNQGMTPEEIAALIERDRMRECLAQGAELDPWRGDDIVHNAQQEFTLDEDFASHQKVRMFRYRASQRVFNGNYGSRNRTALHTVENLSGAGTRNDSTALQHALCGFVAEGTKFALNGDGDLNGDDSARRDFHHRQGSWEEQDSANGFFAPSRPQRLTLSFPNLLSRPTLTANFLMQLFLRFHLAGGLSRERTA
jgi:hypothetical protein